MYLLHLKSAPPSIPQRSCPHLKSNLELHLDMKLDTTSSSYALYSTIQVSLLPSNKFCSDLLQQFRELASNCEDSGMHSTHLDLHDRRIALPDSRPPGLSSCHQGLWRCCLQAPPCVLAPVGNTAVPLRILTYCGCSNFHCASAEPQRSGMTPQTCFDVFLRFAFR